MRKLALVLAAFGVAGCSGNGSPVGPVTPASVPPGGDMAKGVGSDMGTVGSGADGGMQSGGPSGGGASGGAGGSMGGGGSGGSGGVGGGGSGSGGGGSGGGGTGSGGSGGSGGGGDMGGTHATCTPSGPLSPTIQPPDNDGWTGFSSAASDGVHIYLTGREGKFKDGNAFMEDATSANPGSTARMFWGPAADGPIGYLIRLDGPRVLVVAPVGSMDVFGKDGSGGTRYSLPGCGYSFATGGKLYCAAYNRDLTSAIYSVDESSGTQTTLAPLSAVPTGMTHDASYVYFTIDNQAFRAPLGGGTPELVTTTSMPIGPIAADDTSLYLGGNGGQILRAAKTPGAPAQAIAQAGHAIDYLITDGRRLYAAADLYQPSPTSQPFDEIVSLDRDGGNLTVVVERFGVVYDMSTDDTYVYAGGDFVMRACK